MHRMRALLRHELTQSGIRYAIAGSIVGAVYLSVPVIVNGVFGVAIEIVIPFAYALALCIHFTLQRKFVFRHVEEFALTPRQQVFWYLGIAAVQYPATALLTAVLPGLLGVSQRVAYVLTAVGVAGAGFLLLRTRVFHPSDGPAVVGAGGELPADDLPGDDLPGETAKPVQVGAGAREP